MNSKSMTIQKHPHIHMNNIKYIFYGTGPLAEAALYSLYHAGLIPIAIITKPDSLIGRHQVLTEPMIKTWAKSKNIKVYQPTTLSHVQDLENDLNKKENTRFQNFLQENKIDIAIVASYGKIIPEYLLHIPTHGTLNIHPSMLPLYRGPSPIESQILDDASSIGLSIMQLDAGMDSGPVYIQTEIPILGGAGEDWDTETIERICGRAGADLISQILAFIIEGTLQPIAQDNNKATFCKFIKKEIGEIKSLTEYLTKNKNIDSVFDKEELKRKWHALRPWPGIFFFIKHKDKNIRIKINKIDLINMDILSVTPEGKNEMDWESFRRGYM